MPLHVKRVATLPCELLMSENSNNLKRVVIYDISQGN